MTTKIFTSESVTEGHPDKVCDQISDAILDEYLKQDSNSRVACETLVAPNTVVLAGEISSKGEVNIEEIAKRTLKEIGYTSEDFGMDYKTVEIISKLHTQSADIAAGVDEEESKEQGAGDQGMMFGFACDETKELMPLPISLAHKLTKKLAEVRHENIIPNLGPDGKSQVSVVYEDDKPKRIDAIVIAQQHTKDIDEETLRPLIIEKIIKPVCGDLMDEDTNLHINATGQFIIGGPVGDSGLTGRKIIVDTYGGMGRHGGGAFSGKDSSKVDRSAAYMARHIAKNIVAKGFAKKCEIQLSYAIGVSEPTSIFLETFNTNTKPNEEIIEWVKENFKLNPKGIVESLELKKPIFRKTAANGHFGREEFSWEKLI